MKKIFCFVAYIVASTVCVYAARYEYKFHNTAISEALAKIGKEHPEMKISFLYDELDKYYTSASISTDNDYEAVRKIVSRNPIYVSQKGKEIYVEAMQHGVYSYSGKVIGNRGEPVAAATVLLLEPSDSTVITYGIADDKGRFTIPCDKENVVAKLSCIGYFPTYIKCNSFSIGTIVMQQSPTRIGEITIESNNAYLYSDRSVYIPTSRQKNSAQTATDLIMQMAIPQLSIGNELMTNTGKKVSLYIDFIPAAESELNGMRTADVKKVEYYEHPTDPRFHGDEHVINFIMQQYEYGGYVKGSYSEDFITARILTGYAKLQYKRMTYDIAAGGYNMDDKNNYSETDETYRPPQDDGGLKVFQRNSKIYDYRKRDDILWASFKALYKSEHTTGSNMFSSNFSHMPTNRLRGTVSYSPAEYESSAYKSDKTNRVNSLVYRGYWQFLFSEKDVLALDPYYSYSHTSQYSIYDEIMQEKIENGAKDNSHQVSIGLYYRHSFQGGNNINIYCPTMFLQNKTQYSGTSSLLDISRNFRISPSLEYSITKDKISLSVSGGIQCDRSSYSGNSEKSTSPCANTSFKYAYDNKNSLSFSGLYKKSIPASSYRSASVIQDNPLFAYTGNPAVEPYNYYMIDGSYTYVANKMYNFSVYGFAWIVDNRYVYDYEANSSGVIRQIRQPGGSYAQWEYGIKGSTRQLNGKLILSAVLEVYQAHNGTPYNWRKTSVRAKLNANYYIKNAYFGAMFLSSTGYADGCMVGDWVKENIFYSLSAGWNYKDFNFRLYAKNIFSGDSNRIKKIMHSEYYDKITYQHSNPNYVMISATYTFSFGKKIEKGNEAYQDRGTTSGILK